MKPKHWIRIALIALIVAAIIGGVLKLLAFSAKVATFGAIGLGIAALVVLAYLVVAHATRKP